MLSHPSVRSLSLSPSSSFSCSFIVSSGSFRCRLSIVIYLPFAFFRFFSPASLITSIVVVLILLSSFTTVFTRTPSISVFPPALSLSSIARSVRISLFMIVLLIFDFTAAIISLFIRKFIAVHMIKIPLQIPVYVSAGVFLIHQIYNSCQSVIARSYMTLFRILFMTSGYPHILITGGFHSSEAVL